MATGFVVGVVLAPLVISAAAWGLPDVPAIERDVSLVRDRAFTYPHIPPLRTTADGRVGVSPKPIDGMVRFHTLVPEAFSTAFVDSPSGDRILAERAAFEVPETEFVDHSAISGHHYAVCDVASDFPIAGELTNPYACGLAGRDDCYDFAVVTSTPVAPRQRRLWGTPVTVRVAAPKTIDASIAEVSTGRPRPGVVLQASSLFEVTITNDGRLLTGRIATRNFEWVVPATGEKRRSFVDVVYAFNGSRSPCDVDGWTELRPISHAPYDEEVRSRYGFAMHPFRDATGNVLPDGADLGISYPWVDRSGTNLFYTSIGPRLSLGGLLAREGAGASRYPMRCVPDLECSGRLEPDGNTRGLGVVGLWTRGKMVLLDGILNNIDYGLEIDDAGQRMIAIYNEGSGPLGYESGEVRIGSGHDTHSDERGPPTYVQNTSIVDSLENLFHASSRLRPVSPRDTMWIVNSGKASDEIAFDDWLDRDVIVFSEMVGATAHRQSEDGEAEIFYHDGWSEGAFRDPVKLQNAATVLPGHWVVPVSGTAYGAVRLEPVALGGVRGKGLWLDGRSGVEYELAEQTVDAESTSLYVGIFLDSRFPDDAVDRTLITLPDGARIALRGRREIAYFDADGVSVRGIELAEPLPFGAWTHLGFQTRAGRGGTTFFRNGFAFDRLEGDEFALRLVPGSLLLGKNPDEAADGIRGWIDNFLVVARDVGPELACNHALGTLAGLDDDRESASGPAAMWIESAAHFPDWAHDQIRGRLESQGSSPPVRYVCFHGYERDRQSHMGNLPDGLRSMRRRLLFPEGPLRYGKPRPDSLGNSFCLSCHSHEGKGGLSTAALAPRNVPMEDDPRRQPSQPLRRVFGNVPADWLDAGQPPARIVAPAAGLKIEGLLEGVIDPVDSPKACPGDCDGDQAVTVGELVLAVGIALDRVPFATCRRGFDCGPSSACIDVAALTRAVGSAVRGCGEHRGGSE